MSESTSTGPIVSLNGCESVSLPSPNQPSVIITKSPNLSGLGFYFIKGNASWRVLLGCQLIPGTLMFACSFLMPESPRFLAYVGRHDEALAIMKKLHGDAEDDTFYLREYHQIKAQIELDREERLGMKAIWAKPSYRRRFLLVFWYAIACM